MARKNTPATYACGNCGTLGHNKRTCPALGLAPKAKAPKKPRAKKVETATVEVAPLAPVATEEQLEALRSLVAEIEAQTACDESEVEAEEIEPTDAELEEIEAGEVDAAFEAEIPTTEEVVEVTDEDAAAFMSEYAALFA